MKTARLFSFLTFSIAISLSSFAQKVKTEMIPVAGNCGMCEAKIEKAAKQAGASSAEWSADTKSLTVKYNSSTTNAAKIQQAVASVGYDTRDFKASDESYKKLSACCQYDRATAEKAKQECSANCTMKDGKCTDMDACKDKGCCKAAGTDKTMSCCAPDAKDATGKMDCCKNGKCEKHS